MQHIPVAAAGLPVGPRLVAARWDSLWIHGDATALEPPLVALVGTRDADQHGLSLARSFAHSLARNGVGVLSGGALGIDAAAHGGALDAGGRTAVVLPSGLEHWYPRRHAPLYQALLDAGGALVSPFPPETPPTRWTFPRRNELLAALCDLLVVVQAPVASGSLITAEAARRLGRRVLVVPASPGDPRGTGCLKLLRMGAELCSTPADALAALTHRDGPLQAHAALNEPVREPLARTRTRGPARAARAAHAPARTYASASTRAPAPTRGGEADRVESASSAAAAWALDDPGRAVYESLAPGPRHVDEIAGALAMPASRVRATLMQLLLLGLVAERGEGFFTRAG